MSVGRYLSLEDARVRKTLKRFCKEHPSTADKQWFDRLMEAMTKPDPKSSEAAEEI
jgi:hypothetical protein